MIEPDEPGTHSRKSSKKKVKRNWVPTREKRRKIGFNVRLDPDVKQRLDAACETLRMERNSFVTRAIKRYLRYKQGNKK